VTWTLTFAEPIHFTAFKMMCYVTNLLFQFKKTTIAMCCKSSPCLFNDLLSKSWSGFWLSKS